MRARIALVSALTVLVAAGAACSGGSQSQDSNQPRPALSTLALTSQADAACRKSGHAQTVAFRQAHGDKARAEAWAKAKVYYQHLLSELRALRPQPGARPAYERYVAALTALLPYYDRAAKAEADGTAEEYFKLWGVYFLAAARSNDLGADLGLQDCVVDYDTADPPDTKREYIDVVDSFCYNLAAASNAVPRATNLEELVTTMGTLRPAVRAFIRDVQALPPPPGDEAILGPWIEHEVASATHLLEMGDEAKAGSLRGVSRAANQAVAEERRADKIAVAYGIDGCTDTSYLNSA